MSIPKPMPKRRSPEIPTAVVKRQKHGSSENAVALTLAPAAWLLINNLQQAASDSVVPLPKKMKPINNVLCSSYSYNNNVLCESTGNSNNLIPFVALGGSRRGDHHQTSSSSWSSEVDVIARPGGSGSGSGVVLSWWVRKVLEKSDVNSLCRLMLKKEVVESQILCHWSQEEKARVLDAEGRRVVVYDRDTASLHGMTLRRWGSSKCYVLNSNWSVEFVKRRALIAGDEIGLHWDTCNRRFVFSVLLRKFL